MNPFRVPESTQYRLFNDREGNPTVRAYLPSLIYGNPELGKDLKVGGFTEISGHVVIGDNVIIGGGCFIPEGVTIEDDAWIGPKACFTNDRFPPSPRDMWEKTLVKKGARIGAGCTILCGITIGEGALIGAGSTVTKDVPAGEIWCGNPAKVIAKEDK